MKVKKGAMVIHITGNIPPKVEAVMQRVWASIAKAAQIRKTANM
jgi:hypothetical protein